MKVKSLIKEAIKSRVFVALSVLILLQTIFFVILVATNISSTDVQIPIQYSAFNPTQYVRDQWSYLFNFVTFAIVIFIANLFISLKILETKGRQLMISFLWLTSAIIFISTVIITALLRVAGIG